MKRIFISLISLLTLGSCATHKLKIRSIESQFEDTSVRVPIDRNIFLIGDAGKTRDDGFNPVLDALKKSLDTASDRSWAIFLGDNIYPAGLPSKKDDHEGYQKATVYLDAQIHALSDFQGSPLFIPGNHDWYSDGIKGLKRQEEYLEKALDDNEVFQPENGCGFEKVEVDNNLTILVIDSQWYITDWDRDPAINADCEFRSRSDFFEELEGEIKKNKDRTTLILIHNPLLDYGSHGHQYSFRSHFFPFHSPVPLPVIGTVFNELRTVTGASHADLNHPRYRELKNRVLTLAQFSERVLLASGHDHSLQYIVEKGVPQIVSGSGAKRSPVSMKGGSQFAVGERGFARLELRKDGSSRVYFYVVGDKGESQLVYATDVLGAHNPREVNLDTLAPFPEGSDIKASVYTPEETRKGAMYRKFWGNRYRDLYSSPVNVPMVDLDTLFGGLKPVREGGGHQSFSLRLKDPEGKPYVMRALRKSAEKYLQAILFQDQFIIGQFEDTGAERFIEDFYTGSHPYAPFTVEPLARELGISHTRPKLYYIPRQKALGDYNETYGDALYMIEEHVSSPHADLANFGGGDKILSTADLLEEIRDDSEHRIDAAAYVRARLFDMVLGDWDRHPDQWRWSRHKMDEEKILYRPIPRDRDQVFSQMGDGWVMGVATRLIPSVRLFEGFSPEIRNTKGFNSSPKTFALDMALLSGVPLQVWEEQARYIQTHLTEESIRQGISHIPEELGNDGILSTLMSRKDGLLKTAREYHSHLNKRTVLKATDKDDIVRVFIEDNQLVVQMARLKGDRIQPPYAEYTMDPDLTREVWIYGLDDKDLFEVTGVPRGLKLRLIGGQGKDEYKVVRRVRGVSIHEDARSKNDFDESGPAAKKLRRDYQTHTYRIHDIRDNSSLVLPQLGANPDDGFRVGVSAVWTGNGLVRNPYSSRHVLNAQAYLATSGWDVSYTGEKAGLLGRWNLEWNGRYTAPNFAVNFFGLGNSTLNSDDELGRDYNRVRLQQISLGLGGIRRGKLGSQLRLGADFQSFRVAGNGGRFIEQFLEQTGIEETRTFLTGRVGYEFENYDLPSNPALGFSFSLEGLYSLRMDAAGGFGVMRNQVGYVRNLTTDRRLVFSTQVFAQWNITRDYEFYQAASIGARTGLRGYRFQRFSGQTAFSQSTDLRWNFPSVRTGLFPARFGLFAGYDYGRVWQPGDPLSGWHHSAGGGFTWSAADLLTLRFGAFGGEDGLRFAFTTGARW